MKPCPKCQTTVTTLEKHKDGLGCPSCLETFPLEELINHWGWDIGDFQPDKEHKMDTMSFEPVWKSAKERNSEYETVVYWPLMAILSDDEYEYQVVDYGYPIGQVGL